MNTATTSQEHQAIRLGLHRAERTNSGSEPSSAQRMHMLEVIWIAAILAQYLLHFPHVLADFPNHSPWMDYAKYTDEGWYGNAAARFTLNGHWYLHGDFNPAVALPVWPLLLSILFHFTGVSLAAARLLNLAILGINLLLSFLILRTHAPRWIALLAITMLAANPFLYAFSRLAILEQTVVCLMLLAWWLVLRFRAANGNTPTAVALLIGFLLCLMVLAKTTALLLVPSVLFLLAYGCGFRLQPTLRSLGLAAGFAISLWCAWYFLLIRPHYRADYDYFFQANRWPQPVGFGAHLAAYWWALHGLLWISPTLCITALVLPGVALVQFARSRKLQGIHLRNPLAIASLLAIGGYLLLIGMQNHPQPRYYQIPVYPLIFLLALTTRELIGSTASWVRITGAGVTALIAGVCLAGTIRIAGYIRHPEYTWVGAATNLSRTIHEHPAPNTLLLSVSGDEIQLITGTPAICDDYGTWPLPERLRAYRPAWYAAWNDIDEDTQAELETQYSIHEVAHFPAFDDPDRNVLVLYRLKARSPGKRQVDDRDWSGESHQHR